MKFVILDGHAANPGDLSWQALAALGELTVYERTPAAQTVERIGSAELVLTNKTLITAEVLAACPQLRYVGVLASGYNVVDIAAATRQGVTVCNVPGYSTDAVAQMVFALLLEVCDHVGEHNDSVHWGEWSECADFCYWKSPLIALSGRTLGIVGMGQIGCAVATIAKAFGMRVITCGSRPTPARAAVAQFVSMEELLATADVISLHCPLKPETKGIINRASIAAMKDGVILINTSRGPLVVESDLAEALNSGKVYAAAVDVVSTEPIAKDNPLLGCKNCIFTPHIAWAAKDCRIRLLEISTANVQAFLAGTPQNAVN
ncbi:MAG: D-2-hydroxyacid dehydrogenase [Angelakisella sp.]